MGSLSDRSGWQMSETIAQTINRCFMLAWDEFGDDKSTEFLVQITADRLGVEPEEVYDALASEVAQQERQS
jgi:Flp pilus assembly protein TadB